MFIIELAIMNDSLTLTLSGKHSILQAQYYPQIELHPQKNYVIGLVELHTFNSIPNIDKTNNKFYVKNCEPIVIPEGSYEIEDIHTYLSEQLSKKNVTLDLKPNNNTLRSIIHCTEDIDFQPVDCIGRLLGFKPQTLVANETHHSDLPVSILKVNSLRVECNITTGSYINEKKDHCIHEFFPAVPPGYKIIEVPLTVIYLPVSAKIIDNLQLRIVDQDGNLVNFRGEEITIRLHLKSI